MKMKKMSLGMKFLIVSMVIAMIAGGIFGVSSIFAEPTIEDLSKDYIHELGTFEPSSLIKDNQPGSLVGWLNTAQIFFSHDMWIDFNGDGVIDSEDVYKQEGFESDMLMRDVMYPIFDVEPDYNYYIIPMPDYALYNSVIIELAVANNNDMAQLKDQSTYWYDRDHNYLYISKDLVQEDFENQIFNSIRCELISLTKDVDTMTKSIEVYTLFDASIDNTHGLYSSTPNGTYERNVMDWIMNGLHYQLVQPDKLAYVSDENLTVYINRAEAYEWQYDETTGIITIACDPYTAKEIAVKFNKINDVSLAAATLNAVQFGSGETGQAKTMEEALTGDNLFLHELHFTSEPVIGATTEMDFVAMAYIGNDGRIKTYKQTTGTVPLDEVREAVTAFTRDDVWSEKYGCYKKVWNDGAWFYSTTLAAYQGTCDTTNRKQFTGAYGQVAYNMIMAHKENDTSYINQAVSITETILMENIEKASKIENDNWNLALSGKWRLDGSMVGSGSNEGRYVTGIQPHKTEFLGGTIVDGYPFFDVVCARVSDAMLSSEEKKELPDGTIVTVTRPNIGAYYYYSNASIVKTQPNSTGTGGYLYVCVWTKTILNEASWNDSYESQRILAFSRIPYTCDAGRGKIRLIKTDAETGLALGGAVYGVYSDANCTQLVTTITSSSDGAVESGEIGAGTYYIKETTAPSGFVCKDNVTTVTVEAGGTVEFKDSDTRQNMVISLTVYDQTTELEEDKYKVPLADIEFQLFDSNNRQVGNETYKTNNKGKIVDSNGSTTITVKAQNGYYFKQLNTIPNYTMDPNVASNYYCYKIAVPNPTSAESKSGENIERPIVHYEQRQEITIHSHVQDYDWRYFDEQSNTWIDRRDETPAVLGGAYGGYVQTTGAEYQLYTMSKILLGYVKGKAVEVNAGELLTIYTYATTSEESDDARGYSTTAYSHAEGNAADITAPTKAYAVAWRVKVKVDGKDYDFPLPNGTYKWVLNSAPQGYYNDPATKETVVDAAWDENNQTVQRLIVEQPVLVTRQKVELELYAKYYLETNGQYIIEPESRNANDTVFRDDVPSGYDQDAVMDEREKREEDGKDYQAPPPEAFLDKEYTKTIVVQGASEPTSNTSESLTLRKDGSTYFISETEGPVPNAIYALVSLCDVVDIRSGEVIPANTPLGFFITDNNGYVKITSIGNDSFENPNTETRPSQVPGTSMIHSDYDMGGGLPNGVYALNLYIRADNHYDKVSQLASDWTDAGWSNANVEDSVIESTMVSVLEQHYVGPDPWEFGVPVAPDPDPEFPDDIPYQEHPDHDPDDDNPNPNDPSDPYDPDHPDDPTNYPDDSNDIPLVPPTWIHAHSNDFAYRISDPDNFTEDDNGNKIYDVSDKLPTTFSLVMDTRFLNVDREYRFKMSFYYEISPEEYNNASEEDKASGKYGTFGSKYAMRFATEELSGGELLNNVIVLNQESEGYVTYSELAPDKSLSGAIYNTAWLDQKLAEQADGEYTIFVVCDISETYVELFSGEIVTTRTETRWGHLRIRNRALIPLD